MEKVTVDPLVLACGFFLSALVALVFTLIAVGPRSRQEAVRVWGELHPVTPAEMAAALEHITQLRRDPEFANMFFLSRFLVMIVLESIGQLFSGMLAAVPLLKDVPDRLLTVPFALVSLWLAAECLIAYRRITNFDAFRDSLRARARASGFEAELAQLTSAPTLDISTR